MRVVEVHFIEEGYGKVEQSRGIDSGHEILQIIGDPTELKTGESREDRVCRRRW
jgi:hypothetical protein